MDLKSPRMIVDVLTCLLLFLTIANLSFISQIYAGQLYHWKDKDGNVYVSDTPPDASVHRGEVKSMFAPEEPATESERKTTRAQPPAVRQKEVTIYTNTT
jgi:hypothetical protein